MSFDAAARPEPSVGEAARDERVEALFDPGAVAFVLRGIGNVASLSPSERACAETFGAKRRAEFAAGRACAHAGLREIGLSSNGLLVERDRRPRWPAGAVGSITHTDGYCGAVVARRERYAALGIDVERTGRVDIDLWPHLFVDSELALLRASPRGAADLLSTVLFSAKESLYKCRFGVTEGWLDFTDVAVAIDLPISGPTGTFVAKLVVPDEFSKLNVMPGRYITDHDVVWSAVALAGKDL